MGCFPLDNTEYTAKDLGAFCATRTRGVFSGDTHLVTTTNGDLSVTVSPGIAWLKPSENWGAVVLIESEQTRTSDISDGALTRWDAVCLRIDKNQNTWELVLKKGPYGSIPVYPPLLQDDLNYDEIFLAVIRRRPKATVILADDIVDLRLNETYCGIMRDGVTGIPTQSLYNMWVAWFEKLQGDTQISLEDYWGRMTLYETGAQADFEAWVESIKGILNEEMAGHLKLEIDAHAALRENPHGVTAEQAGALGKTEKAANSAKLDGQLPSWYTPVGVVNPYAGATTPSGWLLCNGAAVSRTTYKNLFAVCGTTYGTGNGSTTFNVPNMGGRFALGSAAGYVRGAVGGEGNHKNTIAESAAHAHNLKYAFIVMNAAPAGAGSSYLGQGGSDTTHTTGGDQPHNNMPPYLAMNYIIKY